MNKKTILMMLIMSLSLVLLFLQGVQAVMPTQGHNIQISLVNQNPDPVQPGSYADVKFGITNYGMSSVDTLYIKADNNYPFTVVGEDNKQISGLASVQTDSNMQIVHFLIQVNKDAYPGKVPLTIEYSTDKKSWIKETFYISIGSSGDKVLIGSAKTTPEVVQPGKKVMISINLTNYGNSLIKDVHLNMDLSSLQGVFAPVNTPTNKEISFISPKQSIESNFMLILSPNAKSGVYSLPMSISYKDSEGRLHEVHDLVGVIVGGKPSITMQLIDTPEFIVGRKGELTFKVINSGILDSKFVKVTLPKPKGLEIESPESQYVGDIDSDDYETVTYDIKPEEQGNINIPVKITAYDALGNEYNYTNNINIRVYSEEEARKLGLIKTNNFVAVSIIILVVLAAYFVYKKVRKH